MPVKGFHMLLLHLWSQYLKLLLGEFVLQLEELCSLLLFDLGGTFAYLWLVDAPLQLVGHVVAVC